MAESSEKFKFPNVTYLKSLFNLTNSQFTVKYKEEK